MTKHLALSEPDHRPRRRLSRRLSPVGPGYFSVRATFLNGTRVGLERGERIVHVDRLAHVD